MKASVLTAALATAATVGFRTTHGASILSEESLVLDVQDGLPDFDAFMKEWGRDYARGGQDYEHRRNLYEDRMSWAQRHNSQPRRLWTAGVNQHWDWKEEELDELHGGFGGKAAPVALMEQKSKEWSRVDTQVRLRAKAAALTRIRSMPRAVNWGHLNSSKRVHDQGKCGSCWAVTAATLLDMHHEIYRAVDKNELKTFSAQDLVNCVPNENECGGQGGCHGATVELALDWAWKNGAKAESQVPYHAKTGSCKAEKTGEDSLLQGNGFTEPERRTVNMAGEAFGLTGWQKLEENEYEPLVRAVYENGPVGVSVHARGWHFYKSGIFDECQRDVVLGHAVTLLGYGQDRTAASDATKYWLIQNSWGSKWGENGRIRLLRTDEDQEYCGTDDHPEKGTGCKGGPPEVTVCGHCGVLYDSAVPKFRGAKVNGALIEW